MFGFSKKDQRDGYVTASPTFVVKWRLYIIHQDLSKRMLFLPAVVVHSELGRFYVENLSKAGK